MKNSKKCASPSRDRKGAVRRLRSLTVAARICQVFIVGSGGRYGRFSRISWQARRFELFLTVVREPFEAGDVPVAAIRAEPGGRFAIRQTGPHLGLGRPGRGPARRR